MHNMGQLKSRQFYRRPSVQPIARASSFHTIDNKRHERYVKNKNRQQENQNIYDLANIMQQLHDHRPKGSQNQNPTFRNKRAETLIPTVPKLKSLPPKTNPLNLIDLLKQHRQNNDKIKRFNTAQQTNDQKTAKKMAIQKNNNEQAAENKKLSQQHNECRIKFQTIQFPEGVCKASISQDLMNNNMIKGNLLLDYKVQKSKALSKNLTDYSFVPNNKITINNIDKLIFKNQKIFKKSPKNEKKSERDLIKTKQKQQLNAEKQQLEQQFIVPKQKKVLENHKIPEFIKASLQGYHQESQYMINKLMLPSRINPNQASSYNNDELKEVPDKISIIPFQVLPAEKSNQQDNLLGAKLNLYQKQKRKSSKFIDYIRQRRENNLTAEQSQKRVSKLTSRQRLKKTCVEDQFSHKICGWEQGDVPTSDPMDFRI